MGPGDSMSATATTVITPAPHAHAARRRGFEILSRLARGTEAASHGALVQKPGRSDPATETDYEPRHRREDTGSASPGCA